jgi:hypothetical protein
MAKRPKGIQQKEDCQLCVNEKKEKAKISHMSLC